VQKKTITLFPKSLMNIRILMKFLVAKTKKLIKWHFCVVILLTTSTTKIIQIQKIYKNFIKNRKTNHKPFSITFNYILISINCYYIPILKRLQSFYFAINT